MAVNVLAFRRSNRRFPLFWRVLLAPLVATITIVGLWVFAGRITNDFALSMVLTGVWFGFAGLVALVVSWRWRPLLLPVLGTFVVTATAVSGYLAWSTFRDVTVNERIATGGPASQSGGQSSGNVQLSSGEFVGQAHHATGAVAVVQLAGGGRVLTLTNLDTDNGPDLRVYLVAGPVSENGDAGDFVDLGALRGNRGNQQYEISGDVDLARYDHVSVWCRAFSVSFGMAQLRAS